MFDHVLDLLGEHRLALAPARGPLQERAEGQHLAEDGRGLGQSQWRCRHQRALPRRQHLVHTMAELMGQRHHIPRLAHVIYQHIGVRGRHGGVGKGARRLARAHRRVDPVAIEEVARDVGHARVELAIGAENRVACLVPADHFLRASRDNGALRSPMVELCPCPSHFGLQWRSKRCEQTRN